MTSVVWPFVPGFPLTEILGWRSDLLRAKSAEQRIATRAQPRQLFRIESLYDQQQFSRAQSMAKALTADTLMLPNWADLIEYGAISAAVDTLTFDTTTSDYTDGGQLIVWQSDTVFEVATIDMLEDASITLSAGLGASYTKAYVMPLLSVRFVQPLTVSRAVVPYAEGQCQFVATTTTDLGDASAYATYRSHPVMTDTRMLAGDLSERFVRESESIDNGTGLIGQIADFDYPIHTSQMSWHIQSRAELWALRQWLHYCRGRQRGFWLPSYNKDLQVTADITSGGSTITVQSVGYPDFETVRDIMIEDTSGNRYYRRINSGVAGGGNTEVLTLSAAAGINLTVAQVRRISYLTYMRNNADRIEIQHYAPGKATVSVPVMEAPAP